MKTKGYFISPALLAELNYKRDVLVNRVSESKGLISSLLNAEHLDALYHSKNTEPDQGERFRKIGVRRDFRDSRDKLRDALDYVGSNFKGFISEEFISGVLSKVEPSVNRFYRSEAARISGYGDMAVNPAKIKEEMVTLINLSNDFSLSVVERASLFHFHCLRIHPFIDGNGRTSRLVQNAMLLQGSYAPATISPSERSFYNDLIHHARKCFKERGLDGASASDLMKTPPGKGSAEFMFLNYLATQVNKGMDRLIEGYENTPHYEVMLRGIKDPGEVMKVKKIIYNSLSRGMGMPASVRVTNLKKGRIEVRAKIEDGFLTRLLDKSTNKSYKIIRFN